VEDPELRSFATGLAQGANNFLGFAMGSSVSAFFSPTGARNMEENGGK
jgi:hypothetical protein